MSKNNDVPRNKLEEEAQDNVLKAQAQEKENEKRARSIFKRGADESDEHSSANKPLIDEEDKEIADEVSKDPYHINKKVKFKQELVDNNILLSVRHLKQFFFFGSGINRTKLKAVHDISFDVKEGECFGIVGESGCGKTTTGRSIIRLYDITSGSVYYKGYRISGGTRWNRKEIKFTKKRLHSALKEFNKNEKDDIAKLDASLSEEQRKEEIKSIKEKYSYLKGEALKNAKEIVKTQKEKIKSIKFDNKHVSRKLLNEIQMIFQDPVDSLDPRMTVEDIIQEGLRIQGFHNKEENHKKTVEMLNIVGLIPEYASRYPHEFSGGQRQRIGIARALIMNPKLLICDEPISALDVSIRAQIINLLNDLKESMGLTLIFIAHDLSVVKYFCDRIAVMYFGEIVELTTSDELFKHPLHPYTKSLFSAIPKPNPISEKTRVRIHYNPAEAHDYSKQKPTLREIIPGHFLLCNDEEAVKYMEEIKELDILHAEEEKEEALEEALEKQEEAKEREEELKVEAEAKKEVLEENKESEETSTVEEAENDENSASEPELKKSIRTIKETDAVPTKKVYHVSKRASDSKWAVKKEGGEKVIKLFNTKEEALAYSEKLAANQDGSLKVHASKGKHKGQIRKN